MKRPPVTSAVLGGSSIALLVALTLIGPGCARRPREDAPRRDPALHAARQPRAIDAGVPRPDAGPTKASGVDGGTVGAMAMPVREEIAADRVIRHKGYACHVYRRWVVQVSGPEYRQSLAVKAASLDPEGACRDARGPFALRLRTPHRFPRPAHVKEEDWVGETYGIKFLGVFRDLLVFKGGGIIERQSGVLALYDLTTGKLRFNTDLSPWSQDQYEGDGRYALWETVEGVKRSEAQQEKYLDRPLAERLWSDLASLKERHRPLYDGLKPGLCDFEDADRKDSCAWWGKYEVDFRDPAVRPLRVLRCLCWDKSI